MIERELTHPIDLTTADGRLNDAARGWSRRPLHRCALPAGWGRRKRWDYWNVTDGRTVVALTLADLDYAGLASVWILDLESSEVWESAGVSPLGRGVDLLDVVGEGTRSWAGRRLELEMIDDVEGTRLRARGVSGGRRAEVDLRVDLPHGHETLNVVVPWSARRFQFTSKQGARPARGTVTVDGRTRLLGDVHPAFGTLDAGRGRWPYRSRWNWAAAAGEVDGRTLGLQFGGQWTAGTGATENGVIVDGRLHKISQEIDWSYDPADFLAPWNLHVDANPGVDLEFHPEYERRDGFGALIVASEVHQCFGRFRGRVSVGGTDLELGPDGIFGWAEEAVWRW